MLHREPSIEKIGAAIGWAPTRSLDEILADVIAVRAVEYERAREGRDGPAEPSLRR